MHEAANFDRFDFGLRNWHGTRPDPANAPAKDRLADDRRNDP